MWTQRHNAQREFEVSENMLVQPICVIYFYESGEVSVPEFQRTPKEHFLRVVCATTKTGLIYFPLLTVR